MIFNYSWAVWLAWVLAASLFAGGLLMVAGVGTLGGASRWGTLSRRSRLAVGIGGVASGAMIAWYPTRPFGLLLCLVLCLAASAGLWRRNARPSLLLPAMVFLVTLIAAWGLRLI